MDDAVQIRQGIDRDLTAITALYNHYVAHTPITFDIQPWTVDERRPWLAQFTDGPARHRLFVAVQHNKLVGYAGTYRFRPKAAYDTTVECTCYLAPEVQGRGIGTALYNALFDGLAELGVRSVIAAITVPNPASIALHARFGFNAVGTLHEVGHKFDRYWDVTWMEKLLTRGG